ncbi:LuxR family transcriptional regulator [Nocardioides albus]|uniref:DNA-binding CsgD family transcriptional regulator n=2 Tax=Nocardioides albus TaxID=1841 RepID=A0A7W5A5K8_9ACTN|nr:DNA-binding CsgD family transcriptional regulator [Nocardioides albus]GGU36985.1 LuxR family transcriptional regulator [Nocardioides albus]
MYDGTIKSDGTLARPRLLEPLLSLDPGGVGLVYGPRGSGRTTVIRQWLDKSGLHAVWVDSTTQVSRSTRDSIAPDVIVVDYDDVAVDVAVESRRAWPRARLVVMTGIGWPAGLRVAGVRPDAVVAGRTLRFTRAEVQEWAAQHGVELSDREATGILDATAGYPAFIDTVIQVLAERGRYDPSALAEGCDRAASDMSAAASAGGAHWSMWETLLLTGHAGELATSALDVMSGRDSYSPYSVRAMQDAELLIVGARPDTVGFPPAIRAAMRRRFSADLTSDRQMELVRAAMGAMRDRGLLADAIAVADGDRFRTALFELLGEEWLRLDDVPAGMIRDLFAQVRDEEVSAELWIVRARALIDTAQRDRATPVAPRDRQLAQRFLDRAESRLDKTADSASPQLSVSSESRADESRTMIAVLRAVEDRSAGRHEEAEARLRHCLANPPASDPANALLHIHAGLSVAAADRPEEALAMFAEAVAAATVGGAPRLAALAADCEELIQWTVDDPGLWWRHIGATRNVLPERGSAISRTLQFVRALHSLDVDALRQLLSESSLVIDDPVAVALIEMEARVIAHQALQRPKVALQEIDLAEIALRGHPLSVAEQYLIILARAELLLDEGDPHGALALLDAAPPREDPINDALSRARVLLGLGRFEDVIAQLPATLEPVAGERGRFAVLAHLILALAHAGLGDQETSDRCIEVAIVTGARNRIVWPYVRVGSEGLRYVLDRAAGLTLDAASIAHLAHLETVWETLYALDAPVDLSDRELVVLERLANGESVRRVAVELHVSPNTVKTQLRTLYRKLGVSNRADAIRTARLRGLLVGKPQEESDLPTV